MNIEYKKVNFIEEENRIEYKNIKENKQIYFNVCLYSDKFREYQKNLFNDFYTKILELVEKNDNLLDFKKNMESEIKQFNTQLKIFQEKVNIEDKITIKWVIQIIWDKTYIAALIWESSLIIFRENKLESVIVNEVEEEDKIDIFWEIIEWELEDKDKIITIYSNIYNYMTDDEIKELVNTENILNTLEDILTTRVRKEEIWKIEELDIHIEKIKIQNKENFKLNYNKYIDKIKKHKYAIATIITLSIIFFIIFAIFSYLWENKKQVVEISWKKVQVDLDDIKRQVDAFWKLNFNKWKWIEVKKAEYEKIMKELNALEKENIQTIEIQKLKKALEKNYYNTFNINIISKSDDIMKNIYNFWEKELKQLSWINQIVNTNLRLNIVWEKWAIIWFIDKKYKWILQTIKLPIKIKTCSKNLAWNGLYCITDNDSIYNISKYWVFELKNSQWTWPKDIVSIGIYWNNKIYLLTKNKDLNKKWIYIIKYVLKWKNKFWPAINYIFSKDTDKNLLDKITTGSNLFIDWSKQYKWSFLISWIKSVLQAYRKDNFSNELNLRNIPWWEKAIIDDKNDFSWKLKVIANIGSKYLHVFDFATNSLITYLTSPYKTNDKYFNSYNLIYKHKVKFLFDKEKIKDVIVTYNSTTKKQVAYILTDKWIYSLDLWQF